MEAIALLAGHNQTATTELIYRHQIVPALTRGAEVMDQIFGYQIWSSERACPASHHALTGCLLAVVIFLAGWASREGWAVLRSRFGDWPAEVLKGDGGWLGSAAYAGVEGVERVELVRGEVEAEHVEVLRYLLGPDRLRDGERPRWRCQRSITWAAVLPWTLVIARMAGSGKVLFALPR